MNLVHNVKTQIINNLKIMQNTPADFLIKNNVFGLSNGYGQEIGTLDRRG